MDTLVNKRGGGAGGGVGVGSDINMDNINIDDSDCSDLDDEQYRQSIRKHLAWYEKIGVDACLLSRVIIFLIVIFWILFVIYAALTM
ncbi:hypothetical protein DFA_07624 [Cavenderia fasciculata]|uniref:Uncharacterized protein n=1 Tax=Cavenderia fasciculata TaxID=261658 RepID=F4Q2G7_CACFS|nr:uncharacterized protein DFA_07624 [Cavenderia fasciculata]EGG16646.1 hypothetical protein DFA_07624 [Cavenderia fasciculata]|eukprot:XP_004355120.1 hypothetical protein DFA_07624 [Cavenderia fasciculata]